MSTPLLSFEVTYGSSDAADATPLFQSTEKLWGIVFCTGIPLIFLAHLTVYLILYPHPFHPPFSPIRLSNFLAQILIMALPAGWLFKTLAKGLGKEYRLNQWLSTIGPQTITFAFTDAGMKVSMPGSETFTHWRYFKRSQESDRMFAVVPLNESMFLIPKRCMNPDQIHCLRELLNKKMNTVPATNSPSPLPPPIGDVYRELHFSINQETHLRGIQLGSRSRAQPRRNARPPSKVVTFTTILVMALSLLVIFHLGQTLPTSAFNSWLFTFAAMALQIFLIARWLKFILRLVVHFSWKKIGIFLAKPSTVLIGDLALLERSEESWHWVSWSNIVKIEVLETTAAALLESHAYILLDGSALTHEEWRQTVECLRSRIPQKAEGFAVLFPETPPP